MEEPEREEEEKWVYAPCLIQQCWTPLPGTNLQRFDKCPQQRPDSLPFAQQLDQSHHSKQAEEGNRDARAVLSTLMEGQTDVGMTAGGWVNSLKPDITHAELCDHDIDNAAHHDQSIKRVPGIHKVMLREKSTSQEPSQGVFVCDHGRLVWKVLGLTLGLSASSFSSISTVKRPVNTMLRMSMTWLKVLDCS